MNKNQIIHLLITTLCDRNCKHCCNKQYDTNKIPFITDEELSNCRMLLLTGGEPFKYSSPNDVAEHYKKKYPNIEKVIVYTNAAPLLDYISEKRSLSSIDGVSVSIKTYADLVAFNVMIFDNLLPKTLQSNRLYCFGKLVPTKIGNFELVNRVWQENFVPADDSIFRRI